MSGTFFGLVGTTTTLWMFGDGGVLDAVSPTSDASQIAAIRSRMADLVQTFNRGAVPSIPDVDPDDFASLQTALDRVRVEAQDLPGGGRFSLTGQGSEAVGGAWHWLISASKGTNRGLNLGVPLDATIHREPVSR